MGCVRSSPGGCRGEGLAETAKWFDPRMRGGFRQVKVREAGVPPGLSAEVLNKIVALVGTSRTADAEFTARIAGPSSIEIPPVQLLSSLMLASYRGRLFQLHLLGSGSRRIGHAPETCPTFPETSLTRGGVLSLQNLSAPPESRSRARCKGSSHAEPILRAANEDAEEDQIEDLTYLPFPSMGRSKTTSLQKLQGVYFDES